MSDLFNWDDVEDKPEGQGQRYIYPGIYHNIVIQSIKQDVNKNGNPVVKLTVYSKEGGADTAKSFDMYLTEKALKYTQRNLLHIGNCIVKEEEFKKAKSIEEINDLLAGETLRMQFNGEEYEYNGEIKTKAVIGFPPFAEPTQEGAEHPVVADEDTKLKYDPEKQLKRLDVKGSATVEKEESATPEWGV